MFACYSTMRRKGHITPTLLLLIFLTYPLTDARQCSLHCSGSTSNLLKFKPGKTYQYKLQGTSVTTLPGAKNDVSKLGLEAKVEVGVAKGCEHVLALTDVKTIGPDDKAYSLDSTIGSSAIKFGLQNGKIIDLCTIDNESLHALNIKRAALSLLQSTVLKDSGHANQHETDVFGHCPTSFEFIKHGAAVVVRKTRDLTKCSHREDINFPFSTSTYFTQSEVQTSPLLSGSYNSEQKFEGGVLKSATSEEVYSYNPMSAAESATTVKVSTKLIYVGEKDKPAPNVKVNQGKSLVFQAEHPEEYKGGVETMVKLLQGSCGSRNIDEEVAAKFTNLVRAMANAPKSDLLQLFQKVKSGQGFKEKDVAKKMYLDALAEANSASSVEVIAELLNKNEVTGHTATYFTLLLGSVKHATRASLKAVANLLDGKSATYETYLAAGTLGGRFCREHNCAKFPEVTNFQNKLAAPLLTKGCKPANKIEEDKLLASLKGLANMRYLTKPVVNKLIENAVDSSLKARVRVALLETMRSDANKPEFKKVAGEVFKNPLEDSEVRIRAYLVLAECPCGKVAELVKSVLEKEKSYQVGGYVVSHLRNLRASTNPEKASAKHHLGALLQTNKYPIDFRKYSQNYEFSYNVGMLNLGASAESNVIYSQKSYIPRSVSLNLTSYMFGHSFNWLEVDVRSENLEKALENILGPRGKLRKNKVNEVYDELRESANSVLETAAERYEQSLRPKRSVTRDQLDALANKVSLHYESEDEVDVDIALKMYGAERFWLRYHGGTDSVHAEEAVNRFFEGVDDGIKSAKNIDLDYRKHFSFLDEEVLYPTGLGFALKVKAYGSTAYRVKVDGKLDVQAYLVDPKNTDFRLQFLPSAAVEVRGDIVLDGVAVESGVKVTLNLHTSTGSDITFRVNDGRGVDVKFGLPVKNQDILVVHTDVSSVVRQKNNPEKTAPVVFDVQRESVGGCFDFLQDILGLTLCAEADAPWEGPRSLSPAYGPSKLSIRIIKADDTLTYYHFKVNADDSEGVNFFEILFDTPNSKVNRKMLLHLEGAFKDQKYFKMNVKSPWTEGLVEAALIDTPKELLLNAKVQYDDVEYYLKTGAIKSQQGNTVRYEPVLEYKAPEQAKSALVGRRGGPRPPAQLFKLSGAVIVETNPHDKKWKFENLALHTDKKKYSIDGKGSVGKYDGDLDVVVEYDQGQVKVKGHYKESDNKHLNSQLTILPSQNPETNIYLKWDALNDKLHGKYDSRLEVVHGPDPNSATNKVLVHNSMEVNRKEGIYGSENSVSYPLLHVDGHVGFRVTPKSIKTHLKGKYDAYSAEVLAKGAVNTKKEGDYNAEFRWELMGNSVDLTMSRVVLKNHQSKFLNVLDIKPGGKYELSVHATHKVNDNDVDLAADVDLLLPEEPKNIKVTGGLKHNAAETKGQLNAVADSKPYLQSDFYVKHSDKPSGNYKVKFLDYINSNGDFEYDGTHFKAKSKLDFPKQQRHMDGKANLVVTKSHVKGTAEFCWDTSNAEKTLKLETDTKVHENDLDSKNSLTVAGKKTLFNVKGSSSGELKGHTNGELELVLSNGHLLKFSFNDVYDLSDNSNAAGEFQAEFFNQESGKSPNKLILKAIGKNIDVENLNFDGQVELSYYSEGNARFSTHAMLKKAPKGDKQWLVKGEITVSGTIMENGQPLVLKFDTELPVELFVDSDLDKLPPINYHVSLSHGQELQLKTSGKLGETHLAADLEAKLPHGSPVTSLKWATSNVLDVFNDDNKYKVKSNNELHWNENNYVKVNGEANCEPSGLNYMAEWETNNLPKRKLTGSAHWSDHENSTVADANAALAWEGKNADISLKLETTNEYGAVHLLGTTPEHGKFDFLLKNKLVKDGKGVHSDLALLVKDKKISASSKVELIELHPLFEIVVDHPDGKSRFLFKADNKGERHWTSELKAKWTGERSGSLSLDSEYLLKSIDNFLIKHNLDAPTQGLRKFQAELSNKPGRGDGKKITFSLKKDEKLLVSASSNYVVRVDGNKKIVEGNGQLKSEDQQYPLSFKGSWIDNDSEKAAQLDVKSGKFSVNFVYKHTDNEFNVERKLCRDGECSKAQVLHRVRSKGLDEYENTVVVALDLHVLSRQFKDVSYVASYKRKAQSVDHLVEAKYGDEVKFKYNGYIHEKDAGVLLTLPKRTVGTELKYDVNIKEDGSGESVEVEVDLYFNKEKHDKLCLISNTYVVRSPGNVKVTGETKLTHPSLKKDLSVKGHYYIMGNEADSEVVLDLFKHENQKVYLTYKGRIQEQNGVVIGYQSMAAIKNDYCKVDHSYEQKFDLKEDGSSLYSEKYTYLDHQGNRKELLLKSDFTPQSYYLVLKLPSVTLFEMDAKLETKGQEIIAKAKYLVVSSKYYESLVYNKETNAAAYQFKWDDKVLNVDFGILMGKSALLNIGFNNKPLARLEVGLDETNFLKSNYNYDNDVAKHAWHATVSKYNSEVEVVSNVWIDYAKEEEAMEKYIMECLTKCAPDFSGFVNHATQELKQLSDEVTEDEDVSNALNHLKEAFGTFFEHITVFLEEVNKFLNTVSELVGEFSLKMSEVFKEMGPKLAHAFENFAKTFISVLEQNLKFCLQFVQEIMEDLEKYKEDFEAFNKVFSDVVHEVGKQFAKVAHSIHEEVRKFIEINLQQFQELPITNMIKEKYEELKELRLPEEILMVYVEAVENLKPFLPTPECEDFVTALTNYITQIMKQEQVDNAVAGKQLYEKLVKAVKSLVNKVNEVAPKQGAFHPEKYVSFPLVNWLRVPAGSVGVSTMNLLRSRDFLLYISSFETYAFSLNPLDNVPPFHGYAHLVDGTEVITFDGRHYHMNGLCSYVLAEDYVDRNFSVVGHFINGKLEAVTTWDEHHSITLRKDGPPLKNGLEAEYPLKVGLLKAWKIPTGVGLRSKAGVVLFCSPTLDSCALKVSGFYFNKLRGLFGNLNYEIYDDLVLPEGTVGNDPSQFCNSWKVDNTCPDVPAIPQTLHKQKECSEMFGSEDSDLILGRPWLPFNPFRDACDNLVASAGGYKKKAACKVAKHYVFHAQMKGAYLLEIPSECAVCEINNKKVGDDDSVVVTPGKAADVVFLVDVLKKNEDVYQQLVQPLVPKLKDALHKHGVNDVRVVLASYNSPTNRWTNYHSVNGKLEFSGYDCIVQFEEPHKHRNDTWVDRLLELEHQINLELGETQQTQAYEDIIEDFDFRPHALKSVVGVHSEPCPTGLALNLIVPARTFIDGYFAMSQGVVWNVITPLHGFTVDAKDGVTKKDIVGFTDDELYTINKGSVKGDADYDTDFCVNAAKLTGGAVIPSVNFRGFNKEGKGAIFVQKTAENLAKSILKAKEPMECECGLHHGLIPKVECEVKNLKG